MTSPFFGLSRRLLLLLLLLDKGEFGNMSGAVDLVLLQLHFLAIHVSSPPLL